VGSTTEISADIGVGAPSGLIVPAGMMRVSTWSVGSGALATKPATAATANSKTAIGQRTRLRSEALPP
jgi:hypothetical protein